MHEHTTYQVGLPSRMPGHVTGGPHGRAWTLLIPSIRSAGVRRSLDAWELRERVGVRSDLVGIAL
eukprot:1608-Prymnesium_polylepis.1